MPRRSRSWASAILGTISPRGESTAIPRWTLRCTSRFSPASSRLEFTVGWSRAARTRPSAANVSGVMDRPAMSSRARAARIREVIAVTSTSTHSVTCTAVKADDVIAWAIIRPTCVSRHDLAPAAVSGTRHGGRGHRSPGNRGPRAARGRPRDVVVGDRPVRPGGHDLGQVHVEVARQPADGRLGAHLVAAQPGLQRPPELQAALADRATPLTGRAGLDVVGPVRRPARPAQGRLLRLDPGPDEHCGPRARTWGRSGCVTRLRAWLGIRLPGHSRCARATHRTRGTPPRALRIGGAGRLHPVLDPDDRLPDGHRRPPVPPARSTTTPAYGLGSSTAALAVSTSSRIWLTTTVSPTATRQPSTSASVRPSPASGIRNSCSTGPPQ